MAQSRIGYNINGAAVADSGKLKIHLAKVSPTALLVMDGLALAQEMAVICPRAIVIHRDYGAFGKDDDLTGNPDKPEYRVSPQQWIDHQLKQGAPEIWRYAGNEMGYSAKVIQWYIELIKYNAKQAHPLKLVIGNWSAGTPGGNNIVEAWGVAKELLYLCDQYREWVIISLHEYACAVITSGLYGGSPENAGVEVGKPGGKNLIPPELWPMSIDGITTFHIGRFRFLLDYCRLHNIKTPRLLISEFGMDHLNDIKDWPDKLQNTQPYTKIRGWKTLVRQWAAWWYKWNAELAYFNQLRWADRVIYQNTPVEGELIFTWSENTDWTDFNIAHAETFQGLLENAILSTQDLPKVTTTEPPPPPVVVPAEPPVVQPPDAITRPALMLALVEAQQLQTAIAAHIESLKKLLATAA